MGKLFIQFSYMFHTQVDRAAEWRRVELRKEVGVKIKHRLRQQRHGALSPKAIGSMKQGEMTLHVIY